MSDGHRDRPVLKKPFAYEELVQVFTAFSHAEAPRNMGVHRVRNDEKNV